MRQLLGQQRTAEGAKCGGGSNAELASKDEGGQSVGVCYGGICTGGVVVRAGKGGRLEVYDSCPWPHTLWPTKQRKAVSQTLCLFGHPCPFWPFTIARH
jgi:hypothetical protein